jgi:hypothetical protein
MKKYEIINHEGGFAIYSSEESAFFAGYDFMGSVDWVKIPNIKCLMTKEEAEMIVSDLEAADEEFDQDDPSKRDYLVQIRFEGEVFSKIMTGYELADRYETEAEAGIGEEYAAFDIRDFGNPVRVSVYDIVMPIIDHKRWMEQEYRDYCDAVNEYGYDFEGRDE